MYQFSLQIATWGRDQVVAVLYHLRVCVCVCVIWTIKEGQKTIRPLQIVPDAFRDSTHMKVLV